ncbi:sulfotransferase family protein [Phaeodactylibacter luteus]|uniref:Sulfotransferase domain-containing protein n=1 Tax=Phaeodactylibacter luteus TaxID=1564516 RepID=A0A5C6RK93_9BACT|nr:hypothetical protein [Phaeodactylibacter luteus]TXB62623.1 hypothetical protein FRY97_12840 [Phaeodactylibacter luteus]
MNQPEIYFHVGLGKVASTYLQHRFFPKLKHIYYIPTNRYRKSLDIIGKGKYGRYFVSREFDQQLEEEVRWFSSRYPQARPIIIFRRHDSWIASQYRRYVKNGGYLSFREFFDVEEDTGLWKREHVTFYRNLEHLEHYFEGKPLVLFYDELRADPWAFFDKIAQYAGSGYDRNDVSLAKVHTSYNEKQLKAIRKIAPRLFDPRNAKPNTRTLWGWLQRRGQMLKSYAILYPAKLIPASWLPDEPLIPQEELDKVRAYFEGDWARCKAYAEENNPKPEEAPL